MVRLARLSICCFTGLILQALLWSFLTQVSSSRYTTSNSPKGPLISLHNTTATWSCKDWNSVKNQQNVLLAWLSEINIPFPGTMKDATVLYLEPVLGVHCLKSWRRFLEYFVAGYMMNSLPQSIRDSGKLLTLSWLSFLKGSEPITVWIGRTSQKFSQCKRFAQLSHTLIHKLSLLKARKSGWSIHQYELNFF